MWYLEGVDGAVSWVPDSAPVPEHCICGRFLRVTDNALKDGRPIELQCDGGHRWREVITFLEEECIAHRALAKPPADPTS